MGSHNDFAEVGAAKAGGFHHLLPPANGGTMDLRETDGALVLGDTANNETWYLPAETATPLGTILYASNKRSGTIAIKNLASVTVGTVTDGQVAGFMLSANRTWTPLGSGVTAEDVTALQDTLTSLGHIGVPLTSISKEDGTQMIKQATTVTGFAQLANKNLVIHIPANSTAEAFAASINSPPDTAFSDGGASINVGLELNVVVSKSADADELTLDAELYTLVGNGGGTFEWSGDGYSDAGKTIPQSLGVLRFAFAGASISGAAQSTEAFAFVLTLGGTNDSDVVYIHDVYWTYQKKLLTN